jgi:hypothetical protein
LNPVSAPPATAPKVAALMFASSGDPDVVQPVTRTTWMTPELTVVAVIVCPEWLPVARDQ